MKRFEIFLLAAILIVALVVRLYEIKRPLADWHSWRQADTAAVARNFIKDGYNPFIPRYDDMSSQANGLDNPNRYRFVEFPIYNSLVAALWSVLGISVTSARLVTVAITLGSTALLYLLTKHFSGTKTAFLAAFFFATIPYNVFYSSTILPGPLMVFAVLGMYYTFTRWLASTRNWSWPVASVLFANLAILSWPIALFFTIPLLYLAWEKYGTSLYRRSDLIVFAILSLLPFLAWRLWMTRFPEGIPNWQFLLNEGGIRFKGAFFRWLITERIAGLILASTGFVLFIIGLTRKSEYREKLFYLSWLLAVALYFTVMASGNIRHDYYQVPFVPIAAIYMAKGVRFLTNLPRAHFNKVIGLPLALFLIVLMYAFGFYQVRGFYWTNKPQIVKAGQAADMILPKDAIVIAPYNGDAAFLYQTNRRGYPIVDRPLEVMIESGAKYLVSVDVGDPGIQNLVRNCSPIQTSSDYVIIEMFIECIGKQ
ncbi:glycosyltransferase family 39 protein [Candidatus Woesebacteria bacterium]|nr:glycosyltransferase family 39 protein [Candidatus Woesebacteria bacterium]